jgi:hypothetical protein
MINLEGRPQTRGLRTVRLAQARQVAGSMHVQNIERRIRHQRPDTDSRPVERCEVSLHSFLLLTNFRLGRARCYPCMHMNTHAVEPQTNCETVRTRDATSNTNQGQILLCESTE